MQSEQETLQQHPQSPVGAAVGIAPVVAGAKAAADQSQSIAANSTQPNSITIIPPSGTSVPSGFVFVETTYEPRPNITADEVVRLSDNDLLTGLKKQHKRTQEEMDAFLLFFDEALARFSDEQPRTAGGQFQRGNKPTLPEAFAAIGLNYETERKRKQRYLAAMSVRFKMPKPLQLTEGDRVKPKDGAGDAEYTVVNVHQSAPKVDIVPKGDDSGKVITLPTDSLKKINPPIRKVRVGDLLLCDDNGTEYQYVGGGKLSRTKTPTLLEQKRERELAAIKAKKDRQVAKSEEKKREQELRKAEAARRDLEKIAEKEHRKAEADAQKQAARLRKAAAAAAKANKRSKGKSAKPMPIQTPTHSKTELVKVARIGGTQEFGVYPESCLDYTAAKAQAIGTKLYCESERDRINAKRLAKRGSPEGLLDPTQAVVSTSSDWEASAE